MARFIRRGNTRYFWVPTLANPAAATVAEITAGDELSDDIFEINGFEFNNTPAEAQDMGSSFDKKVPGTDAVADSNMTMHQEDDDDTLQTALAKGNEGFVVIFVRGTAGANPAAADEYEAWPAIIASNTNLHTAGNETAKYRVTYTLTEPPVTGAVAA
jgi:hypothetical protein